MSFQPDMTIYAGVNPNKLPKIWFPLYVVYKYTYCSSGTYIIGFETDELADKFQNELLAKKEIARCEIFGHYPLELLT